jgi:hypothetical protein
LGESAGMEIDRRSSAAVIAVGLALVLAVPALAAAGGDSPASASKARSAKGGDSGGTPTRRPPEVRPSGGVAGPSANNNARAAQAPDDQPPQVEQPTETETTPTQTTPTETAPSVTPPEQDAEQAPGEGAGQAPSSSSGGLGLPSTGLQLGGLVFVGASLLLAGWALRRRPA